MGYINCYHGTNKSVARRFFQEQKVKFSYCNDVSSSDFIDYWLGDGFYLFDESFYAFKWISHQCKSSDIGKISKKYDILKVKILYSSNRVFDLNKLKYKTIFDTVLMRITEKKIFSHKVPQGKIPDGVVINYLFHKMNYQEKYDIVKATYIFNEGNYEACDSVKLGYITQVQYCIKNELVIKEISFYNFMDDIDEYIDIWETLFPKAYPFGKIDKNIYNIVREEKYYES